MMVALITRDHGYELAAAVSDWLLHTQVREGAGPQRMDLRFRLGVSDAKLLKALRAMEAHIETPLSRDRLATLAGVSLRQLERPSTASWGAAFTSTISPYGSPDPGSCYAKPRCPFSKSRWPRLRIRQSVLARIRRSFERHRGTLVNATDASSIQVDEPVLPIGIHRRAVLAIEIFRRLVVRWALPRDQPRVQRGARAR